MTDAQLIRAACDDSGVSIRVFALYLLAGRDPRTVERWRAGEPMPSAARDWLAHWLSLTPSVRAYIIRALIPAEERRVA